MFFTLKGRSDINNGVALPMAQIVDLKDNKIAKTPFKVGDLVVVHYMVREGEKNRIQPYEGLVIAKKGSGAGRTFTVRHIGTAAVGVERIFPLFSPNIKKIEVKTSGKVRRAKLYYLRGRQGKKALEVKTKG